MSEALAIAAQKAISVAIGESMRRLLGVRADESFELLMEELRLAEITPEEAAADDATVARMITFFFAMSQGAARRNMRVLAQILARRAAYPLRSEDDFVSWANVIGSLRREEVALLGTFQRHQVACVGASGPDPDNPVSHDCMLDCNRRVKAELIGRDRLYKGKANFLADATALSRTGLLTEYPVIDGEHFQATRRMSELCSLARWEEWADDALASESVAADT